MRFVKLAAALALVGVSLSGCYALDRALFGPGYHSGDGHHRHQQGGNRHGRDHRGH